ncbi:uncharacterized protein PAE49_009556 [Odontesthes bonariensis]
MKLLRLCLPVFAKRDQAKEDEEDEEPVRRVKLGPRRLSQRTMDPEDLRPFNDQVHWVSSRTNSRPNSPVQVVCTASRPAQLREEELGRRMLKPSMDLSPQTAALLNTALLEEPEQTTESAMGHRQCMAAFRPAARSAVHKSKRLSEEWSPCRAATPSRPSSPLVLLSRVDPLTLRPECNTSLRKTPKSQAGLKLCSCSPVGKITSFLYTDILEQ